MIEVKSAKEVFEGHFPLFVFARVLSTHTFSLPDLQMVTDAWSISFMCLERFLQLWQWVMQSALQPNFIDSLNINRGRSGPSAPPKSPFIPYRALCAGYSCFHKIDDTLATTWKCWTWCDDLSWCLVLQNTAPVSCKGKKVPNCMYQNKNKEKFQLSLLEKGEEKWSFSELESLKQESNPPNKKPPKWKQDLVRVS